MAERNELRIDKLHVPGGAVVRISGDLDANLQQDELLAELSGVVVFDLDNVKRITSFGVREWVAAMGRLTVERCCLIRARPAIVAQLNMVSGFAGPCSLVTLYLPYACDACATETEILVDLRTSDGAAMLHSGLPSDLVKCASCGANAEFDDVPESYLSFALGQGPLALPDTLDRLVDTALGAGRPPGAAPFRAQKEVTGDVTGLWFQGSLSSKARFRRLVDGLEGTVVVVLAGVDDIDDDGAQRLLELARTSDAEVCWARVPLALVEAGSAALSEALRKRLVSVMVSSPCASCGDVASSEVGAARVRGAATGEREGGSARACRACGAQRGDADAMRAREHLDLFAAAVPTEVSAYLKSRAGRALAEVGVVEVSQSAAVSGSSPASNPAPLSRYEVVRPLGRGGMAEVFVAKQRGPEGFVKQVALKRILPELASNEHFSQLLLQEARVAAAITHPNVVQIFDLGREDGAYFIAMELVDGWDLRTVISAAQQAETAIPIELACRITADICAGLHAAHTCVDDDGRELEIVHRDVSPHNVLLSANGAVKLTDFGVSKVADSLVETRAGNLKGKVIYMAPEQIDPNRAPVDRRTDLWAVGVVLWEMLSGTPLFRRDSEYMSMFAVLNDDVPSICSLRPDVPLLVDAIIARCLRRDPAERFSSAGELQLSLETTLVALGHAATPAHLSQWLERLADRSFEAGAMGSPMLTPTHSTASIDGGVPLAPAPKRAAGAEPRGAPARPRKKPEPR